jgi:hypothetical protein
LARQKLCLPTQFAERFWTLGYEKGAEFDAEDAIRDYILEKSLGTGSVGELWRASPLSREAGRD